MKKRKINKTFNDWCVENNRQDLLDRWDYKLNKCSPKDIGFRSSDKYYFKCPKGIHESESKIIGNYTGKNRSHIILCNKCNSIAQYLINLYGDSALNLYWDYKKNKNIDPWNIACNSSRTKYWFNCVDISYHGSYNISTSTFIRGDRCPYCSHHKIHPLDSLGTLYPESLKYWSSKNEKTPFQYSPHSGMQVYWKCIDNSHENYQRSINTAVRFEFRCPECSREQDVSILESKVTTYLSDVLGYKVLHEQNCTLVPTNPKKLGTNYTMPFDNEIIVSGKHLLIEVHGEQHYNTHPYEGVWSNSSLTPEQQLHRRKLYDRYKKYIAYVNGYEYLAIPYWTDDKDESYKTLIDDKINEILNIYNTQKKVS